MKFNKKLATLGLVSTLLFGAAGCGCGPKKDDVEVTPGPVETTQVVNPFGIDPSEYQLSPDKITELNDEFKADKKINKDVQAIIYFDSGLLKKTVVQDKKDVNKYLYSDWKTGKYRNYGSITMDPENDMDYENMNIVIYGHYVYPIITPDRTLAFTPLSKLMDEKNYKDNQFVTLMLDNEVRYYQITRVYQNDMIDIGGDNHVAPDDLEFYLVYFTEDYFNTYMAASKKHEYYDTGIELEYGDNILTLQTCIEGKHKSREIVLCRELMRESVEDAKKRDSKDAKASAETKSDDKKADTKDKKN